MTTVGLTDSRTTLTPDASPGSPGLRPGSVAVRPSDHPTPILDVRAYSFWYGVTQALYARTSRMGEIGRAHV